MTISFRCKKCHRPVWAPAESIGHQVACPHCGAVHVPHPGAEWARKRCRTCGSEFHLGSHKLHVDREELCPACGEPALCFWCAAHQQAIEGPACPQCIDERRH